MEWSHIFSIKVQVILFTFSFNWRFFELVNNFFSKKMDINI